MGITAKDYQDAMEQADGIELIGNRFDTPDYDMLIVNDENDYLEHLRVQAAGMAYYTANARTAERNYDEFERGLKIRMNEMYADCATLLAKQGQRGTVRDIESFMQSKYEGELKRLYARSDELRAIKDGAQAFLEGWRQKSFLLSAMSSLIAAGLMTPRETIDRDEIESKHRKTYREILGRKKEERVKM